MCAKPLQFLGIKSPGLPPAILRTRTLATLKHTGSLSLAVSALAAVIMPDAFHLADVSSGSHTPLPEDLSWLLQMKAPKDTSFLIDVILEKTGIPRSTFVQPVEHMIGPLDELKASNLLHGPFKIKLTHRPRYHLTFDEAEGRPMVRLLDFDTIKSFLPLQISGVITYSQSWCFF